MPQSASLRPRIQAQVSLTTSQRGYGKPHQRLRASWAPRVATGLVICWRCGHVIRKGAAWDLGHDDFDRRIVRGPEHVRCNRATAGRRVLAVARTSREW